MSFLNSFLTFSCCFTMLLACNSPEENSGENQQAYPEYFVEVLQAHGGLDKWKQMGTLEFHLQKEGNTEVHIIDLKNRKNLIKASSYTIGHNGEQVWVSPDKASFPGKSAKFYHNLHFYFLAIPFVLADPGVAYEQLENMELQGQQYQVIEVSFGEGVGNSPEDKYRLLLNPNTKRLEWLLFTVTFFDGQPSDRFNALKYENYQEHQGLLFPHTLTSYSYEGGQAGEIRNVVRIDQLQLKEEKPDQQQFEMPEQAEAVQ